MSLHIHDDSGCMHPIDAVLFDMDGTLVDSTAATDRAYRAWAADHGVLDRLVIAHGQPSETSIAETMPGIADERLAVMVAEILERESADLDGVVATTGALDLLAWLDSRRVPWAVVTSADAPLARARLSAAGIQPSELVSRRDTVRGKPDPEPFAAGAMRVRVPAALCLVVEDTAAGVASGKAAGAVTAGLAGVAADLRVDDLPHLHRLLATFPA